MTVRARRIYYSLAILLFCVVAPLIIALASGWRWSGWRQGFIGTGTLVLTSSPRATIILNGKNFGPTPKRISGLAPGIYQLALRRAGWRSWEHIVQVNQGASSTIGPVQLFRRTLPQTLISPTTWDGWLVSADQRAVAGWTATEAGAALQLLWPTKSDPITLPSAPSWIAVSRHNQRLAVGLSDVTNVYSLTNQVSPWTIPPGQPVFWLSSSESIFYRIEEAELIAYDLLTQSRTSLQAAQTASGNETNIWLARKSGETTGIEQRTNTLSANAATIATLPGEWQIIGSFPRSVFVVSASSQTGRLLTLNRLTGRLEETSLGQITSVPPGQTATAPLWLNSVDLLTLTGDGEPGVLFRSPVVVTSAAWIDPDDILVTLDTVGLTIRSVSTQQGRGTLVTYPWAANTTPLVLDVANQSALIATDGRLHRLSWR